MPAYDNTAVAAKLDTYADLLEIGGADKYRFLSYRKAANSVRAWPEQVAALSNQGRLAEVPGVGPKMARIIEEIIRTGSFEELVQVSQSIPLSLSKVMKVPGVGPKRAAQLYERLGVSSIQELEDALADGRVERLGGFGAKTAKRIQESLESHRRCTGRIPIGEALPVALQLAIDIAETDAVVRAEVAGSVRRRADTVGNIDMVVAASDLGLAADALRELPAVERSLPAAEPEHLQLELHDGTRVDVRLVVPDEFGAALRFYTGSAEHNLALEQLGRERGVEMVGPRAYRNGQPLHLAEEDGAFEALGIEPIPPEIREGTRTVAMAANGDLPRLVSVDDVRGDLQSHSTFTDGKTTLEANRAVATALGYEYLAATDHAYALRMVGGLDLDDLERQWAEIDELNARADGTRILKGIELNISDEGTLDYDDDVLARFDVVLASLHSGWDQSESTVTDRALAAISHPLVDIFAHPTGRILGRREPMRLNMEDVLQAAGESGTIMEINSYPDRLDLSAEHISLARRFGVRFSLGTDAHAAEQLRYMPYGVAQARRGLVTADQLINAHSWSEARTWLKRYKVLG